MTWATASKDLASLFLAKEDETVTTFEEPGVVGFSVVKNYPSDFAFYPARTTDGQLDSVALIKIAYRSNQESDSGVFDLFVHISKASKYLFGSRFDYNFSDPDCPTRESLEQSKRSRQPIDLQDTSFAYDAGSKTFTDKENGNATITLRKIIDRIFALHIKTATWQGLTFRTSVRSKENALLLSVFLVQWLEAGQKFFGKQLERERDDILVGWTKPWPHKYLRTKKPEQLRIGNVELYVSQNTAIYTAGTLAAFYVVTYFTTEPLIVSIKQDTAIDLYAFLITGVIAGIYEYILPHLLLAVTNLLIRLRLRLERLQFSIK